MPVHRRDTYALHLLAGRLSRQVLERPGRCYNSLDPIQKHRASTDNANKKLHYTSQF